MKLKAPPAHIQPFNGRSDILMTTNVLMGYDPRKCYLNDSSTVLPPCISSSEFVPMAMIEHLMRNKKDRALGLKYESGRIPIDQITNMEGAMHTFVTPLVLAYIHGDYIYQGGHGVRKFPPADGMQQARLVIVSAQVQPDFEDNQVMLTLILHDQTPLSGCSLPRDFTIPNAAEKRDDRKREIYDLELRRHMIEHLTKMSRLPSIPETFGEVTSEGGSFESFVITIADRHFQTSMYDYLSLELLFNTAVHQLRNELSALEALCPQGYVYTSDPPSIFAQEIGAHLLNRLQFAALFRLASENNFSNMRVFAFNDYGDKEAVDLIRKALSSQPHIKVMAKKDLFKGARNTYAALPGTEGSLLVIHNNSDAFGQNIETEWTSGSMDGAIGTHSSAAASLKRDRWDLVSNLM